MDIEVQELEALSKIPGALRIITGEIRPEFRTEDRTTSGLKRELNRSMLLEPSTYVIHDVIEVEQVAENRWVARSAEGDYTVGPAGPLLRRLRAWRG